MPGTRLIKILKTLSTDEMNSFGVFLHSPFFKRSRNTIGLYNYLLDIHPEFKEELLDQIKVFKKLFPKEDFNERRIRNLISDLTKSAEDFLSQITYQQDQLDYYLSLSKGYCDRCLFDEMSRVNKTIGEKLKNSLLSQKDYIMKNKQLSHLKLRYSEERKDFENLVKCIEDLNELNVFQFISEYIDTMRYKEIYKKNFAKYKENPFVKDILKEINPKKLIKVFEKGNYADSSDIALNTKLHYHKLNAIKNNRNDEYFNSFRNLLLENISNLNRSERCLFFTDLLDYCAARQSKEFYGEGLKIYKKMYDSNSYSPSENQYCDVVLYRNIILFSNSQKDDQWFKDLTEKYLHTLHPDYRNNIKHFAYSDFYFRNKEFEKALEHNSKITQDFFFYKADVRYLLLKIYYELNYFDEARELLVTFKNFVKHNKEFTDFFKKTYFMFLNLYEELLEIKSGKSKTSPSVFKTRVNKKVKISFMPWMIEKANELAENKSKTKAS